MSGQPLSLPDSWHLEPISSSQSQSKLSHRSGGSISDPWNPSAGTSATSTANSSSFHPPPVLAYPQPVPMQPQSSLDSASQAAALTRVVGDDGPLGVPEKDNGKGKARAVMVPGPLSVSVLADMMDSSKGRDKVLVSLDCATPAIPTVKSWRCS